MGTRPQCRWGLSPCSFGHLGHVPTCVMSPGPWLSPCCGWQGGRMGPPRALRGAPGGELTAVGTAPSAALPGSIYIPFRSDTAQRAARPSPGGMGTGSCCLLCPEPLLMCPVCLSVCPSVPAPLPVGGVLARGCISSFHASPPSSSSYAWLCRCSGGILRKSKMFPKCFLFLNNSGDRGLPSSPMSLSV